MHNILPSKSTDECLFIHNAFLSSLEEITELQAEIEFHKLTIDVLNEVIADTDYDESCYSHEVAQIPIAEGDI